MTLQELQNQVLGLSIGERWQLIQWLLAVLRGDMLNSKIEAESPREPGLLKGKLGQAFFEPLPEEELQLWE
jgi:hypothetical protein